MRDEGSSEALYGIRYTASRWSISEKLGSRGPGSGSWGTGDGYSGDVRIAVIAREWSLPRMDCRGSRKDACSLLGTVVACYISRS